VEDNPSQKRNRHYKLIRQNYELILMYVQLHELLLRVKAKMMIVINIKLMIIIYEYNNHDNNICHVTKELISTM